MDGCLQNLIEGDGEESNIAPSPGRENWEAEEEEKVFKKEAWD